MSDFDAMREVILQVSRMISSACRLCELRSEPGDTLFMLSVQPPSHLEVYCMPCYELIYKKARNHIKWLPPPNVKLHSEMEVFVGKVPEFMVKNNEALILFRPTDPIDIGLIKARYLREREEKANEMPT